MEKDLEIRTPDPPAPPYTLPDPRPPPRRMEEEEMDTGPLPPEVLTKLLLRLEKVFMAADVLLAGDCRVRSFQTESTLIHRGAGRFISGETCQTCHRGGGMLLD